MNAPQAAPADQSRCQDDRAIAPQQQDGRNGRSYVLSGAAALFHPDWTLVHGLVRGPDGAQVGHAWVEREGVAYDAIADETCPAIAYREFHAAVESGRWHGAAVAEMVHKHGHWGPWPAMGQTDSTA